MRHVLLIVFLSALVPVFAEMGSKTPFVSSQNSSLAGAIYLNRSYGEIVGEGQTFYLVTADKGSDYSSIHKLDLLNRKVESVLSFNYKILDTYYFNSSLYVLAHKDSEHEAVWQLIPKTLQWKQLIEIQSGYSRIYADNSGIALFANDHFIEVDHEDNMIRKVLYLDLNIPTILFKDRIPPHLFHGPKQAPSAIAHLDSNWLIGFDYGEFESAFCHISFSTNGISTKGLSIHNVYDLKIVGDECFVMEQDGGRNNFFGRITAKGQIDYLMCGSEKAIKLAADCGFKFDSSYHKFGTCSLNVRSFDMDPNGNAYLFSDIGILKIGSDESMTWIAFFDGDTSAMLKVFDARRQIAYSEYGLLILSAVGLEILHKESGKLKMDPIYLIEEAKRIQTEPASTPNQPSEVFRQP